MNKIYNINLGGYPFTIDDDAYKVLDKYLKAITGHFSGSEGCEDIISDIEARIAELFNEHLKGQPIVGLREVESMIAVMGTPEEFGAAPEAETIAEDMSSRSKKSRSVKIHAPKLHAASMQAVSESHGGSQADQSACDQPAPVRQQAKSKPANKPASSNPNRPARSIQPVAGKGRQTAWVAGGRPSIGLCQRGSHVQSNFELVVFYI